MTIKKFTNTDLAKPVTGREKVSDTKCPGLYASITAANGATFSFRYYDSAQRKQITVAVGRFDAERFTVEQARAKAYELKVDVGQGVNVAARANAAVVQKRAEGRTFNEVADLYIDFLRVKEPKKYGLEAPRRESWERLGGPEKVGAAVRYPGGYFKRARASFGHKAIAEVTDMDCALLLKELVEGLKLRGLASNLRTTLFGLFEWCQDPENKFVSVNPCSNLRKHAKAPGRDVAFNDQEILEFWTGLDAPTVPAPRAVALGYKLMLCSGLRGGEVSHIQREWLDVLPNGTRVVRLPAWLTKQRRMNHHPLNALACEVIDELLAMSPETTGPLFPPGPNGAAFKRHMLTDYLNDRGYNGFKPKDGVVRQHGLRSYFGFAKDWRPHDLRHTVASLLVRNGAKMADVTKVLDHAPVKSDSVSPTSFGYVNLHGNESAMLKLPIVTEIDRLLRGILGLSPVAPVAVDVAALQKQIAELQAQVTAATAGKVASIRRAA